MTAAYGTSTPAAGDDDVKRRVRFDAEADLRLLQAVVKREPFAADHGSKLKAWDDVADEVYATAAKLRDVPSSRRAVTDRFHHLLLRYEQGTLKLKRWTDTPNGEEKAALVLNLFRLISARLTDIRNKKAKRASMSSTSGAGRSSISSLTELASETRRRIGVSSGEADENEDDDDDEGVDTEDEVHEGTGSAVTKEDHTNKAGSTAQPNRPTSTRAKRPLSDAALQTELLALKREKLELKRQKLVLLKDQHEQRMVLEQQRLEIATQQLEEARLARAGVGAASAAAPSAP